MAKVELVVERLDELIAEGCAIEVSTEDSDDPYLNETRVDTAKYRGWYIQTLVLLKNVLSEDHVYSLEWKSFPSFAEKHETRVRVEMLRRIRHDLDSGLLQTLTEIAHADLFDDYLEMAAHLVDHGYKDASAVIAGSTCEAHLRKLCDKHGVATLKPT